MTCVTRRARCQSCGMPMRKWKEYHPHAACLLFRATGDTRVVHANLKAVVEYGMAAQAAGIEAQDAMDDLAAARRHGATHVDPGGTQEAGGRSKSLGRKAKRPPDRASAQDFDSRKTGPS